MNVSKRTDSSKLKNFYIFNLLWPHFPVLLGVNWLKASGDSAVNRFWGLEMSVFPARGKARLKTCDLKTPGLGWEPFCTKLGALDRSSIVVLFTG